MFVQGCLSAEAALSAHSGSHIASDPGTDFGLPQLPILLSIWPRYGSRGDDALSRAMPRFVSRFVYRALTFGSILVAHLSAYGSPGSTCDLSI